MAAGPIAHGPVIVGVDGSERSIGALALADRLGPGLGRPVLIVEAHPFKQLSSLFAPGEYERLVREVAESTFDQAQERLRSVREPRVQLVADGSPAEGLHALAEREAAALVVIGARRSRIGGVLVGGTGERLLSGASTPVAIARPATRPPPSGCAWWGAGSTAPRGPTGRWRGPRSSAALLRRGSAC